MGMGNRVFLYSAYHHIGTIACKMKMNELWITRALSIIALVQYIFQGT